MVRLLYGARNSLLIGIAAALITTLLAVILGTLAGYFRGWTDAIISRGLDVLWAFPVLLLGIALGVSLALGGLNIGPITSRASRSGSRCSSSASSTSSTSRARSAARCCRCARRSSSRPRARRARAIRIMFGELLPNLASTILVFFPLLVANAILLEAALSFLGAGVQPPEPSWGTMLADGIQLLITSPHLTIVPGLMLVLTVLSLNVFGDGVRDALDPRAKVRLEH